MLRLSPSTTSHDIVSKHTRPLQPLQVDKMLRLSPSTTSHDIVSKHTRPLQPLQVDKMLRLSPSTTSHDIVSKHTRPGYPRAVPSAGCRDPTLGSTRPNLNLLFNLLQTSLNIVTEVLT